MIPTAKATDICLIKTKSFSDFFPLVPSCSKANQSTTKLRRNKIVIMTRENRPGFGDLVSKYFNTEAGLPPTKIKKNPWLFPNLQKKIWFSLTVATLTALSTEEKFQSLCFVHAVWIFTSLIAQNKFWGALLRGVQKTLQYGSGCS